MYKCKYPHLFSPLTIGNVHFKNRIFVSPTGMFYADPMHRPINETICYYERKAKGGAASVTVGDAMVDGTHGMHGQFCMKLDEPELYPALNKQALAISRHGAVPTLEMFHAGSAAAYSYMLGETIYGPQEEDITGALGQRTTHVVGMTRDIMDKVIKQHVDGALKAKECGFQMVMIHAAHGFLMHQFMSPTLNHRTDEYGGSFENRMRFPLEIVKAVRAAVGPKFPLELRISGSECYEGGYGIDYGCKIAEAFDGIVDIIHVSAGSHEDARVFTVTHPSMFLEDGVNVKYAAEVKKHVKKSYVATVGGLSDPALLEEIIATGKADIVEMARGLICDPDIPNKAREGREDEIVNCVRCFTCFSSLIKHGQIVCALNPEIADESEQKFARPAPQKKKVLIVGGGIAGMEAAITCAKRGHDVTLCEKTDKLGGVLLCEDAVPFKKHLKEYLEHQAKRVMESGIDVRLNTPGTAALAEELQPDAIFCCAGASQLVPPIKGIEKTLSAEDVYVHPEKAGKKVVILGGGLVGSELAIYLGGMGVETTVIEMMPRLGFGDNMLHGMAIGIELNNVKANVCLNTKALEITDKGVIAENEEGQKLYEGDAVICALGMKPRYDVADELRFCAPIFYQIGDCLAAKNIYEATRTAHHIALDLGER